MKRTATTRHNVPVTRSRPALPAGRPASADDLAFLARHRIGKRRPRGRCDAGRLLRDLRDAEWR